MNRSFQSGDTEPLDSAEWRQLLQEREAIWGSQQHQVNALPPGQEIPSEDFNSDSDILRIIPFNYEAREAFHSLIESMVKGNLDEHHKHYAVKTGKSPSRKFKSTMQETPIDWYDGYFRLSLDCPTIAVGLKWIVGRGTSKGQGPQRNVDVLLVDPNTPHAEGLHPSHLIIHLHPFSGAWVVTANEPITLGEQHIKVGQSHCLYQRRTYLEVNDMYFWIDFMVRTPKQDQSYYELRGEKMLEQKMKPLRTPISGIPFESDSLFDSVVFRHGAGSGTFATVFEGFEPSSGSLRIVKKLEIKDFNQRTMIHAEIKALRRCQSFDGVVRLIDVRNSLGGYDAEGALPLTVYLIQEKGTPFNQLPWHQDRSPTWPVRVTLCQQLLKGLKGIHSLGCMHRDVTPQNILFFVEPLRATLCDFGKFCHKDRDTATNLAAWYFLPPEIVQKQNFLYDQKIDVWMLAVALVWCWYPEILRKLQPREEVAHSQIVAALQHDDRSALSKLIAKMLARSPLSRPTAAAALNDPCFSNNVMSEASHVSEGKRARDD